jgi:hypothetical protein
MLLFDALSSKHTDDVFPFRLFITIFVIQPTDLCAVASDALTDPLHDLNEID